MLEKLARYQLSTFWCFGACMYVMCQFTANKYECQGACSEIRSRVLRSATLPFFYDKKNGTVALRSTLERISEHA